MTRLDDWNGLEKAISQADEYSRNKVLLVEEFIQRGYPYVIGGDIFVWNGKIVLYGEMECLRDMVRSPLIPIGEKNRRSSMKNKKICLQRIAACNYST